MNGVLMNKHKLLLLLGMISLGAEQAMAQQQVPEEAVDAEKLPPVRDQIVVKDAETGLNVTEIRYKNRLDEVIVEHGEGGVREYYDFDDARTMHNDGSITERGLLRKWRLGRKN